MDDGTYLGKMLETLESNHYQREEEIAAQNNNTKYIQEVVKGVQKVRQDISSGKTNTIPLGKPRDSMLAFCR